MHGELAGLQAVVEVLAVVFDDHFAVAVWTDSERIAPFVSAAVDAYDIVVLICCGEIIKQIGSVLEVDDGSHCPLRGIVVMVQVVKYALWQGRNEGSGPHATGFGTGSGEALSCAFVDLFAAVLLLGVGVGVVVLFLAGER